MDPAPPISKLRWLGRALVVALLLLTVGYVLVILFWPVRVFSSNFGSNRADLATIGKSRMICEGDHNDRLPPEAVTDAYIFAAYLARTGVLNSSAVWFYEFDPVWRGNPHLPAIILTPAQDKQHAPVSPDFLGSPLAWAVALVPSAVALPAETPIIWTRGLRPDGTWREDSIERGEGGSIFFVGGNVIHYRTNIEGKLHKFGTGEPTSNIIDALPPGTRISEYTPSPDVAGYARELNRKIKQERLNAIVRSSLFALLPLLLVLGGCFAVTHPTCGWLRRRLGLLIGLICAVWFWGLFFD